MRLYSVNLSPAVMFQLKQAENWYHRRFDWKFLFSSLSFMKVETLLLILYTLSRFYSNESLETE